KAPAADADGARNAEGRWGSASNLAAFSFNAEFRRTRRAICPVFSIPRAPGLSITLKTGQHPVRIGALAGEQAQCLRRLKHSHSPALQAPATLGRRLAQQLGSQRHI